MKSAIFLFGLMLLLNSAVIARPDYQSYYSDVETPAVWMNPRNIKVYIQPDETKQYILTRSLETWDSALSSDLNFNYINNPDEADIIIGFVDKLSGTKAGTTNVNHVNIQGRTYLAKVVVYISKASPSGMRHTDTELNKITLHELGHAIGILGHSDNINDIMYPTTASSRMATLSSKDIETAKRIYGF